MRTVVESAQRVPADWVVPGDLASTRLEDVENVRADIRRANRVEQDLDGAARLRPRGERLGEGGANLASPIDVRLDRDRDLRPLDGCEHRRVEGIAVVQQLEAVAV